MTDPSIAPEAPDVAGTAHFLRRFADLMSNGHSATYLLHAAVLLETLAARLTAASDEEQLWRYKYETMTHQNDVLEAECDSLRHDIEGHVNITSSILAERDSLKSTVEAQGAKLAEFNGVLGRARDQLATRSQAYDAAQAELRAAFDLERVGLQAAAEMRGKELDQARRVFEREHEELGAKLRARDGELSELRSGFERERDELRSQLKSREDELAALRIDSERECEALKSKIAALEAKRAELRSAFDRISDLRVQATGPAEGADRAMPRLTEAETTSRPTQPGDRKPALDEASAVVAKATLRQARAQFDYLARECTRRGDIATQVMCELGAYTMELALTAGESKHPLPVGEVALDILAPAASTAPDIADTGRASHG